MSDSVYCCMCDNRIKQEDKNYCCICDSHICNECINRKYYNYSEWCELSVNCSECKQPTCNSCVVFCFDCANEGEEFKSYCSSCVPDEITEVDCMYHTWRTCEKIHENDECGECRAHV